MKVSKTSLFLRKSIVLGFFLFSACGDPSPWGSFEDSRYLSLTEKHLSRLQYESSEFKPFKVALVSDPQAVVSHFYDAKTEINKRDDIAFSILAGDLTDRSLREEFEWVAEIVEDFRRPILTVVGNHDGLIYGEDIYKMMFGPLNYSFIFNDVKFVMWNDNPYEWGYPDFDWLEREIQSHPRVIIVAHQPPGSIERYDGVNERFQELYKLPNVLGSVHGHLHRWGYKSIHGKGALTIERVTDTNWGILEVNEDGVSFQKCKGAACESYP